MIVRVVTITMHAMMAQRTLVGFLAPSDVNGCTRGSNYRLRVKDGRSVECVTAEHRLLQDQATPNVSQSDLFIYEEEIK